MHLPDVTLIAVTSVALDATVAALVTTMSGIRFGAVRLLSDTKPANLPASIEWYTISPLHSRQDYSNFIQRELRDYVATPFALLIQWDGFVLRPEQWQPQFTEYDYIGALWPQFSDGRNVGNGGFSLRSRRLLEATANLPHNADEPEDTFICRRHRAELEDGAGLRFAPEQIARRFAFERTAPTGAEFGFHGIFNLVRLLTDQEFRVLLSGLEPGLLGRREYRELVRHLFWRGRWRTLATLVKQRRSG